MKYINNLKVSENGLSKKQVSSLTKELDKLLEMYPDIIISEIRSYETEPTSEELKRNRIIAGTYTSGDEVIGINSLYFTKYPYPLSKTEHLKKRKELRKVLQKRIDLGIDVLVGEMLNERYKCLEHTLRHEFAHTLDYTYNLENNKDIKKIYGSLTKKDILREVSEYATKDICEFICECFAESFLSDCSDIAKKVRKIIDEQRREY